MTAVADMTKLWFWPLEAASATSDVMETVVAAQTVLGARLPMISTALVDPAGADHHELGRMASEKVTAFHGSHRILAEAVGLMDRITKANMAALGRVAAGRFPSAADQINLFEGNLSLAVVLMTLPAKSMAPVHRAVTANARRLGGG